MILSIISAAFGIAGAFFMFVAALGVWRMPDTYNRLHCSTKAATLGITFLLLAAALPSQDLSIWLRCLAAAVFSILTAPVVGHAIGKAAMATSPEPIQTPGDTASDSSAATASE